MDDGSHEYNDIEWRNDHNDIECSLGVTPLRSLPFVHNLTTFFNVVNCIYLYFHLSRYSLTKTQRRYTSPDPPLHIIAILVILWHFFLNFKVFNVLYTPWLMVNLLNDIKSFIFLPIFV